VRGRPAPPEVAGLVEAARAAERDARRGEARHRYEQALRALSRGPGRATYAAALIRWIARTHYEGGDLSAARDCFEAALAVSEACGDAPGRAHAVNGLGIVEQLRGNLEGAEAHFRWSLDRAGACGEAALVAMIHQNLGVIANIRGDFATALEHYRHSLDVYDALGDEARVGPLLNNLGHLHTDLGQWDEAERALKEAERRTAAIGDLDHRILALVNLARMWIRRGDIDQAFRACTEAEALARTVPAGRWQGEILMYRGTVMRARGQLTDARRHLLQAQAFAFEHEDILLAAEVARELAEVYAAEGRNQDTLRTLNHALALFQDFRAVRDLADVRARIAGLERRFLEIVRGWGRSIESKDIYTQGHCERVADYACALAEAAGFDPHHLIWFRMGALLHDLGKVAIPTEILTKQGPLDAGEWALVRQHPALGVELLGDIEFPWDVTPMIRHHHERWDGRGYPDGLAGDAIPWAARVLAIADIYDALTTSRSYRAAYTREEALALMEADIGRALDPALFRMFKRVLRERDRAEILEEARVRTRRGGAPRWSDARSVPPLPLWGHGPPEPRRRPIA